MLVLTRKIGEEIIIGDDILLTVLRIEGQKVRLGITAPASVPVLRSELVAVDQGFPPVSPSQEYT